jgi:hypothetical protein
MQFDRNWIQRLYSCIVSRGNLGAVRRAVNLTAMLLLCLMGDMGVQGFKVPDALRASRDLAEVMEHGEIFLMVIPTPFVATTMNAIKGMIKPHQVQPV